MPIARRGRLGFQVEPTDKWVLCESGIFFSFLAAQCSEQRGFGSAILCYNPSGELCAADGKELQAALVEWTGQRTVPNVFIGGNHIGGCDCKI